MLRFGRWTCIGALNPLARWILELTPEQAENELNRKGIGWKWISEQADDRAAS